MRPKYPLSIHRRIYGGGQNALGCLNKFPANFSAAQRAHRRCHPKPMQRKEQFPEHALVAI